MANELVDDRRRQFLVVPDERVERCKLCHERLGLLRHWTHLQPSLDIIIAHNEEKEHKEVSLMVRDSNTAADLFAEVGIGHTDALVEGSNDVGRVEALTARK